MLLHSTFTEGRFTDNQCTAVILHGCCENLRRGCAQAVNHHHQRTFVVDNIIAVRIFTDTAVVIPHLHHRTTGDKQAGQINRFCQCTAAVTAQIDNHRIHFLFGQFLQLGFGVIGQTHIETRNIEHCDFLVADLFDGHFHRSVFQTDLLTGQGHNTWFGPFGITQHFQADFTAFGTFDL